MSMLLCFYLPMHVLHSVQYLTIVNREDTWSFFVVKEHMIQTISVHCYCVRLKKTELEISLLSILAYRNFMHMN